MINHGYNNPCPYVNNMNAKRRLWLLQQAVTAAIFTLLSLCIILAFLRENPIAILAHFLGISEFHVKVYVDDLPTMFSDGDGVVDHHWKSPGCHVGSLADVSTGKYPRLRHSSAGWHLYSGITRPDNERTVSSVVRVSDPGEADYLFVVVRELTQSGSSRRPEFSEHGAQEDLIKRLEEKDYKGRDHVFVCKNPNAMGRIGGKVGFCCYGFWSSWIGTTRR
ncbi:Exostosin-like [Parasponia andersonii]|uniref:Exostosin-like n=1 Tax=Parasponia andersonii TaxID=3476 RepID=A0A2P5ADI4_PARAD|nr:Exostosin-like [Parasponia andersonii]